MDKKNLEFSFIALISFSLLVFLYFYSLENAKNYWNVYDHEGNLYAPIEYLIKNPEKFKGKERYWNRHIELKDNKTFIPYKTIYPEKKKIITEIINPEKFQLKNGTCYGFKARIENIRIENNMTTIEISIISKKSQQLINMPWTIYAILFNVPAVIIMLYLLLKLNINFKKFLIT